MLLKVIRHKNKDYKTCFKGSFMGLHVEKFDSSSNGKVIIMLLTVIRTFLDFRLQKAKPLFKFQDLFTYYINLSYLNKELFLDLIKTHYRR